MSFKRFFNNCTKYIYNIHVHNSIKAINTHFIATFKLIHNSIKKKEL